MIFLKIEWKFCIILNNYFESLCLIFLVSYAPRMEKKLIESKASQISRKIILALNITKKMLFDQLVYNFFFLMWTIFKVFIEFVTTLSPFYVLGFFLAPTHVGSQFPNQESNPHRLHWKAESQPLDRQGSPTTCIHLKALLHLVSIYLPRLDSFYLHHKLYLCMCYN